ncbi:winged helix-turn-helix domain-containing protein [Paraburkholderia bannensis]|uniref:winged helix-turn-helix domain-containing protein n=1 Tax=Paraburkholderia bannensis TaxID=765414 RepID=UPI002AB77825|nr:winged helix-turn-helix domain-containing protein [Paraburkholderia bannensis]
MLQIGSLQVSFEQRSIEKDGVSVRIGARAFDILEVLYRANGAILSKDDIMDAVWPGQIVVENRLQVHIAALRTLLGVDRDLIKTVPGRGYLLIAKGAKASEAPVTPSTPSTPDIPAQGEAPAYIATATAPELPALPLLVEPPIGRAVEIGQLLERLERSPATTVVGAGGIGKTALALHVANEWHSRSGRAICFVELARATSDDAVLALVADALKLPADDGRRHADALYDALAGSGCLLVLDNAEHVIDVVARLVEALLVRNSSVRVLVTSREALHIRAESVLRLEPLAVPEPGLATQAMLAYPAVELFLCRARSLAVACAADEKSIALAADICRRLDGLPLAIELAAARVATLGIEGVASRLDDQLDLLTGGLRSALPRHQTLRATFEWSYALLDAPSRILFRRLGCFTGPFTFDAVCAVATEPGMSITVVVSSLGELTSKSLLNVEFHGSIATYRLTGSTRAYAMEKQRDEGEVNVIASRHMRYMRKRVEENRLVIAEGGQDGTDVSARLSLDDARTAYDWAFSENGDPAQGVALAGALVGTLLDASLVHECFERSRRALDRLDTLPAGSVDVVCEMRLCAACASTLVYVGENVETALSLWQRVLRLAQAARDDAFTTRALWGLWNTTLSVADIHASIRYATRIQQAAEHGDSRSKRLLAGAMLAISLHCFGEHEQARERLEYAVAALGETGLENASCGTPGMEPLIFCYGTLARIAWLQGKPAHAMQLVEASLDPARRDTLEPTLSHLLATVAVPVALQCGDLQAATRYLALLRSQVATHRFAVWEDYAQCLSVQIDLHRGVDQASALERLEPALQRLVARGFRRVIAPFIVLSAEALAHAGRFAEAAGRLDDAIKRSESHSEYYFLPELLRAKGWVALQHARALGRAAHGERTEREAQARRDLNAAMALASEHGAVTWKLRAALDLAAHYIDGDEPAQAVALLAPFDALVDLGSPAPDIQRLVQLRQRPGTAGAPGVRTRSLQPSIPDADPEQGLTQSLRPKMSTGAR